jgi:hypothetical protein
MRSLSKARPPLPMIDDEHAEQIRVIDQILDSEPGHLRLVMADVLSGADPYTGRSGMSAEPMPVALMPLTEAPEPLAPPPSAPPGASLARAAAPAPSVPAPAAAVRALASLRSASDLRTFVTEVLAAARQCPSGGLGPGRRYISHVWRQHKREHPDSGLKLRPFKDLLLYASRARLLTLASDELAALHKSSDVSASAVTLQGKTLHLLCVEPDGGEHPQFDAGKRKGRSAAPGGGANTSLDAGPSLGGQRARPTAALPSDRSTWPGTKARRLPERRPGPAASGVASVGRVRPASYVNP